MLPATATETEPPVHLGALSTVDSVWHLSMMITAMETTSTKLPRTCILTTSRFTLTVTRFMEEIIGFQVKLNTLYRFWKILGPVILIFTPKVAQILTSANELMPVLCAQPPRDGILPLPTTMLDSNAPFASQHGSLSLSESSSCCFRTV